MLFRRIPWFLLCFAGLMVWAVSCRKNDASLHLANAKVAIFQKKPEEALREYRLALEVLDKDGSPQSAVYRARALRGAADTYYLELRDFRRAVQVYRELIQQCPEAPETLEGRIHLADVLEREFHDLRGAIAELTAALARNPPQSAEVSFRVAELYFELADYQQCEIEAAKVVDKFETSAYVDDALFLRGQALAMMDGRRNDAQRVYQYLIERFPDSELTPHAMFELGKLRADAGDKEKAIEIWVQAIKRHPQPGVVQSVIARVRKQLIATTPSQIGNAAKAFDRDVRQPVAAAPKRMAKTSVEAVGGSADEAAREAKMTVEPGSQRTKEGSHGKPDGAVAAPPEAAAEKPSGEAVPAASAE